MTPTAITPSEGDVLLLVGTVKGAFVLHSNAAREQWTINGPHFPGESVYALAYDERASKEAALLAAESRALLRAAGEVGLHDPTIARTARDLFQLALDGAKRLGPSYIDGETLATAADFYSKFTARDRSPADDANFSRILTVRSRSSRV